MTAADPGGTRVPAPPPGRLHIVPTFQAEAFPWIAAHHRHHPPPAGYIFALAAADETGRVVGVATVGRPTARALQDGWTAEVTRTCTDGTPNANSALYGSAWSATRRAPWPYSWPSTTGAGPSSTS